MARTRLGLAAATILLGSTPAMADENVAQIRQEDTGNSSSIDQTAAAGSDVLVEQIGNGNITVVTDAGSESELGIDQYGDAQSALVRVGGSRNAGQVDQFGARNAVELDILGDINSFSVSQSNSGGIGAHDGNDLTLLQDGLGNTAFQTQIGQNNQMTLRQIGVSNFADLLQDGENNNMELDQNGYLNSAKLRQFGINAPPILITQNGGASAEITQRAE